MIRLASLALVAALAACGSKQPTPAAPAHTDTGMAGDRDMAEMEKGMSPEMKAFHDVFAPRWHAEKGPQRMTDTCAALPDFHTDADAIAKATPPRAAHADTWTAGTKQLVAAVGELDTTCKANDATSFEAAFQKVHESFHALMMAEMGHDESAGHHAM